MYSEGRLIRLLEELEAIMPEYVAQKDARNVFAVNLRFPGEG